jgi:predicted nucleic acid-binding protein
VLVDTNVFVYRVDPGDPRKQGVAVDVLSRLRAAGYGAISGQTLSEFASVLLGRRAHEFRAGMVDAAVARMAREWPVALVGPVTVEVALAAHERFGFAFFDAQIWAAAKLAGATVVLSEDFSDGMLAGGVRFADPFAEGFDLDALLRTA